MTESRNGYPGNGQPSGPDDVDRNPAAPGHWNNSRASDPVFDDAPASYAADDEWDSHYDGPHHAAAPAHRSRFGRYIIWLGVFVVLACVAYSAAWFWFADRLGKATAEGFQQAGGTCENLQTRGFPFRIGVFCDRTSFAGNGVSFSAGGFRSAAQVYDPSLVVGELDGPARVEAAGFLPLDLSWENLKASTRWANPLPQRFSAEARRLSVADANGPILTAADAQTHLRPNNADLDVAAHFGSLALAQSLPTGGTLPPLDADLDATLTNGAAAFADGSTSLRGREGTIRSLQLRGIDGGALAISGPFAVDEDGLIDADLTLALTEPQKAAEIMAQAFPEQASEIRLALGSGVFGQAPSLPLTINKGRVGLAFLRLGKIEPLD